MGWNLIIQFLILTVVVSGGVIFALYMVLIRTVDGAKQRLDRDAEAARQRESELNQKIKEADAELQKRNKELDVMEKKMRLELEEKIAKQKEEIIGKARSEAEEIIAKAQNSREQIRRDIEKTMEIRIIDYAARITSDILSVKVKEVLDRHLIEEFTEKLDKVDMSRISPDIKAADVISATAIPEALLAQIARLFKTKLSRDIKLNPKIDPTVAGGVVLMFESLQLDGSLQNAIKESANALKQQVEKQYSA
ncbi:MAG: F0F1 ATP synthase subunit delta [Candidatus Omnitrophica bacterium]|nr:F0F1 ATP synthase subunit delta [Candidatus Omnitrophota bacterium]MDE2009315.1 F0F1 ATP synthase subunit delta [Candidatus Omnitrophota bacterium]